MKKIILISSFLIALCAVTFNAEAQTYVRLKQGQAADTIRQSTTINSAAVDVNFNNLQTVTIGVTADSVSGSPAVTFIAQHSVDGRHWKTLLGDTIGTATVTGGVGGVSLIKTFDPFYGAFVRVIYKTAGTAQKSKISINVKSVNKN